jgi:hypothetical protein
MDETARERMVRAIQALDSSFGEVEASNVIDATADRVVFGHSAGKQQELVFLPLEAESLGTQAWFALIGPILRALHSGGTLTIDEIDASLHPHLTSEILRIFSDPKRNPKQAQLLFTSHDTTLLGSMLGGRELTRDQVWFTEKKADGATVLYPLPQRRRARSEAGLHQPKEWRVLWQPNHRRLAVDHQALRRQQRSHLRYLSAQRYRAAMVALPTVRMDGLSSSPIACRSPSRSKLNSRAPVLRERDGARVERRRHHPVPVTGRGGITGTGQGDKVDVPVPEQIGREEIDADDLRPGDGC